MMESVLGPDSVAWRVHSDPSGFVGGIRSLMVQALHPRAMAGVAQHSDFRTDFWGRLRRTSDFLLTVVYGSREEIDRSASAVTAVHRRIKGVDEFTGLAYSADEPELLIWVANATVDSYLEAYSHYAIPLTREESDRYVQEMRILGTSMGVKESDLAGTANELRSYFEEMRPRMAASPAAKEAMRILLNPQLPLRLRPLWSVPALAAATSLSADYRRMYGLSWLGALSPGAWVSARVLTTGLRVLLPPPPVVQEARGKVHAAQSSTPVRS